MRPARRVLAIALVAVLAAAAARIAAPAPDRHARLSAALACGVERWTVKTLQDRPKLIRARATTVAHLVSLPRQNPFPTTRLPVGHRIFSVVAAVTLEGPEARVVGVAFFDFNHGQTGVAQNAIELHPILGFACLS